MNSKNQSFYSELCDRHADALRAAGDIRGAVAASECAELIRGICYERSLLSAKFAYQFAKERWDREDAEFAKTMEEVEGKEST